MIHTIRLTKRQHDRIRKAARINGYDGADSFIKGAALNDANHIANAGHRLYTVSFSEAEKQKIERAACATGWKPGQGAAFVAYMAIETAKNILCKPRKCSLKRTRTARPAA